MDDDAAAAAPARARAAPHDRRPPPSAPVPGAIRSQPLPPPPGVRPPHAPQQARCRGSGLNRADRATGRPPCRPARSSARPAPRGTPQPANTAPQPGDEVITELPSQKIANPTAVFAGLDKITGRIISFDVALNETVQFGALQVTPRVCYTRPPTETANTNSFVDVDEVTLQGEVKRVFTGWMFAASPGLHAVEHPIYDVWLTDCKGGTSVVADTQPARRRWRHRDVRRTAADVDVGNHIDDPIGAPPRPAPATPPRPRSSSRRCSNRSRSSRNRRSR